MNRRQWLKAGCAHCALLAGTSWAQGQPATARFAVPERFERPELATDEGGLWALMDREETRLRRSPFLIREAGLREYLQGIACKLAQGHCADVRVYPVRTPFFNASMAPNGMLQVWSGLLLRVDNEAQIAAVLGHEIGHYLRRHTLSLLRDAKARSSFSVFISLFGAVGLVGQLAALAGAFAFSRDQEREADAIGLQLMTDAGYDPREASKVWDNLRAELAASPGGEDGRNSPMFATHPGAKERSETLARLGAQSAGGITGEAAFAAGLGALQFGLLDDELKRGQWGETLALLDRLVQRSPQRADLLYFRGEARRLRGAADDADASLADLQRAVELGSEPAQVYRALGYVHRQRGAGDAAREAFGRYLERAPTAPDAGLVRTYLE